MIEKHGVRTPEENSYSKTRTATGFLLISIRGGKPCEAFWSSPAADKVL